MPNTMSYHSSSHYLPPSQYYPSTPNTAHGHGHVVSPPPRQEAPQRKRPKYTRSKTGCMTCRVKKIKCDESKPSCMRCTHGQRDCHWPEGVPTRKKSTSSKDSADGRPSTAGSSVSDGSTPPTRGHTPPRRAQVPLDVGLPPLASRRSEPYLQLHPLPTEPDFARRQSDRPTYSHHSNSSSNSLHLIPEITSYPQAARYEQHSYSHSSHSGPASRSPVAPSLRSVSHSSSVGHWDHSPPILAPVHTLDPYYNVQDRTPMGHTSSQDSHRYQ